MKLRSVRYLTGEGIKNVWVNRLMSIASVGVLVACMLIIGVAIALSFNIDLAMGNLEQQNVVMVYFEDEAALRYSEENLTSAVSSDDSSSDADAADSQASSAADSSAQTSSTDSSLSDSSAADTASEADTAEGGAVATQLSAKQNLTATAQRADASDLDSDADADTDASDAATDSTIDLSGAVTEEEAKEICKRIEALPNVVGVEFISSEEGLQRMLATMDETQATYFTWLEEDNPLSCSAKVTMESMEQFDQTVAAIEAMDGINTVYHQRDLAMRINSIKNGIGVAGVWIIALLMVISLVIVANTIRVTMYNRKLEISIMKAVGATNAFIRLPFVVEGVVIGLVSALLSTGLLYFVYRGVIGNMQEALGLVTAVPFRNFVWQTLGLFAIIGVLAGLLGSLIMINKYLRKEGSEFRAL